MNTEKRKRILILAAGLLILAFAGDRLILSPQVAAWNDRSDRILKLTNDLNRGKALLERESQMKAAWQERLDNALPDNLTEAENRILKAVDQWAGKSRLSIVSLKPREVDTEMEWRKIEFQAATRGSLKSITQFLWQISISSMGLNIEEIEMSPRGTNLSEMSCEIRFSALLIGETASILREETS